MDVGFVLDLDREITTKYWFVSATEAWKGAFKDEKVLYRLKKLCKERQEPIILNGHSVMLPTKLHWKKKMEEIFGTNLAITWV